MFLVTPFITQDNFGPARYSSFSSLVNVIVPNLMIFAGIVFFLMMIYAGFLFLQSDGNPEYLKKIKALLMYSIIGFGIIIGSFLLIRLLGIVFGIQGLPI